MQELFEEHKGPALFVVRKEMDFIRPFTVKVHRTPDTFTVNYYRRHSINGKIHDFFVNGFKLELEKLQKRADWKDCTQYGLHFKSYDTTYMLHVVRLIDDMVMKGMNPDDIPAALEAAVPRYGTVNRNGYLINISAALQNGRVTSLEGHSLIPAYRMLNFTVKFKDSKFTEIMASLNIDPKCPLEVTSDDEVVTVVNSMEIYQDLRKKREDIKDLVWRPKLKMSFSKRNAQVMSAMDIKAHMDAPALPGCSICTNEFIWVDIQLVREWDETPVHHTAEVYLEPVNGYLPKNRIILDEKGFGQFKVCALGLEPDDLIKIKAGFRFQTGIADFHLKVMEDGNIANAEFVSVYRGPVIGCQD